MPGKRKSDKIGEVPVLLRLLQSKLWYNDRYKLFFSTHHTNNPQEYYCFFLDTVAGERRHALYRPTTDGVLVTFLKTEYKVREIPSTLRYEVIMIKLVNATNELDSMHWLAIDIPVEKGLPYIIRNTGKLQYL